MRNYSRLWWPKANLSPRHRRLRHQLSDRLKDERELIAVFHLECIEPLRENGVRLEHLAKGDERTDHKNADLNRTGAIQHARGHDRAMLCEDKRQISPATMSRQT